MPNNPKINYVEFPAKDISATKTFFAEIFGWRFEDYGADYTAFFDAGLDGGFFTSEQKASTGHGSALIILFSDDLESTQEKIEKAGGKIIEPIFSFPGGRRFHFQEPSGNELAVWSDK